jgi:predicted  nucleic acid-binding Zn-ribbon protein
VSHRLEAIAGELERTPAVDEEALGRRFDETETALTRLRQRLDAIHSVDEDALDRRFDQAEETLAQRLDAVASELRRSRSVDEEALGRRFVETNEALAKLAQRLDTLAHTVESAASSLGDKERDLASLEGHFTESSTRIESIVDDIREALHVFPELSATSIADLGARLERLESAGRKTNETGARAAAELSERIDVVDQRLATVADEVSRAKTLWPVALRSLEARLEDVAHTRKPEPHLATASDDGSPDGPNDLLTGLRDSLQAMESVAADMARASQTLTGVPPADDAVAADGVVGEEAPSEHAGSDQVEPPEPDPAGQLGAPKAAAGGATVVPLRAGEP